MDDRPQVPADALRGIALKVLSVAVFTVMATLIKTKAEVAPPGEMVFFRSLFALPAVFVWLAWRGQLRDSFTTSNHVGHFWRGLAGVTAMFLGFFALGLLPFPEAIAIGYASPLVATVVAAMFLGEAIRAYRMTAVLVGLFGVLVILSQRFTFLEAGEQYGPQSVGALAALLSAVFAALAQVFVRKLVENERTATIVIYFSLTSTLISLASLPFGWRWPGAGDAAVLVLIGLLGGVGQILLTESYRHAETAVIASFEYSSMIMAVAVGWLLFAEIPTATVLAGSVIVVVAGLFILFRERQLGIGQARARKAMTPQG
jgi:drug/metabolite transporter (DMT)-like permease